LDLGGVAHDFVYVDMLYSIVRYAVHGGACDDQIYDCWVFSRGMQRHYKI